MAQQLLHLPHELISQILTSLSVPSLLKFSQASRLARTLANVNLQTVSLAIQPIRGRTSDQCCEQDHCVRIPDAHTYVYEVLLGFHNTLLASVVVRHAEALDTLDLSIWTLTTPIASAISQLLTLKNLSIQVDDHSYARAVSRTRLAIEQKEQGRAWTILAQHSVWRSRLRRLKVQKANLTSPQLTMLLERNRRCEALWLSDCTFVGKEILDFLGHAWEGRSSLQTLHIPTCDWHLDEDSLRAIGGMSGLQHGQILDMQGCYAMDQRQLEHWNSTMWRIPQLVPPTYAVTQHDSAIEVDPAYM